MRTHMCIAVCILLYPVVALSEQYVCVPDKMTGFSYDAGKKEWDYKHFKTNFKYVIAPGKDGQDAFLLTRVGENDPEGRCKNGFNDSGFLFCSTYDGDFKFNKINGRYLKSATDFGYYDVGKNLFAKTDADGGDLAISSASGAQHGYIGSALGQ
jgi:hypothetical protein